MASLFSNSQKWERRKVPGKPKKPQGKRKGQVHKTPEEQKQFNLALSVGSRQDRSFLGGSDAWHVPPPKPTVGPDSYAEETPAALLARRAAEIAAAEAPPQPDPEDLEECLEHLSLFAPLPASHGRHALPTTPKAGRLHDRLFPISEAAEYESVKDMLVEVRNLEEAAKQAQARNDRDTEYECVSRWGVSLARQDVDEAAALVHEALELATGMGDSWRIWLSLSNLATIHFKHNQTEKAIAYEERCLHLAREMGSLALEAVSWFNLATMYHVMNYTRKALKFYSVSRGICEDAGHEEFVAIIDSNVSVLKIFLRRAQKKAEEAEAARLKKLKQKQRNK